MKCVQDQNGNHVVQKCVEQVGLEPRIAVCENLATRFFFLQIKGEGIDFLLASFTGNILKLSMHPYGCRVVQRIIEHCTGDQVAAVFQELRPHVESLIQHQYGNYVMQCLLEHGKPEQKAAVIEAVLGRVVYYAKHKFASNVVERCMEHGSARQKALLVDEVLAPTTAIVERQPDRKLPDEYAAHITPLQELLADQFGNYVAQKLLDIADDRQRAIIIDLLRGYAPTLRKYQHGRHMLARLEKVAGKLLLQPTSASSVSSGSPHLSDTRVSPAPVAVPGRVPPGSAPPPGFLTSSTPSPVYGMGPSALQGAYGRS